MELATIRISCVAPHHKLNEGVLAVGGQCAAYPRELADKRGDGALPPVPAANNPCTY